MLNLRTVFSTVLRQLSVAGGTEGQSREGSGKQRKRQVSPPTALLSVKAALHSYVLFILLGMTSLKEGVSLQNKII
jgi:hypothetical protein